MDPIFSADRPVATTISTTGMSNDSKDMAIVAKQFSLENKLTAAEKLF